MEPQLPKPQFSPEMRPSASPTPPSGEAFVAPRTPEATSPLEQGRETRETLMDGPKGDPVSQGAPVPPPLPVIDPAQNTPKSTMQDDSNPAAAADEDLIEKEWVEKAKRVVAETRNDPHAQDLAVSRLQADYLKKRYGKAIALPKEE